MDEEEFMVGIRNFVEMIIIRGVVVNCNDINFRTTRISAVK